MGDYKIILAITASIIGLFGYVPYLLDIKRGKTKPHVFSWLVWSILEGIAFFAQSARGGGAGTLVTGVSALFCLAIAIIAVFKGEKNITRFDWLALSGSLIGLILWKITSDPLIAVILITLTDMLIFSPTFRKAYYKPQEETAISFIIASIRLAMSLFAMGSLNLTTGLYPASLVITNTIFVIMLYSRRNILKKEKLAV